MRKLVVLLALVLNSPALAHDEGVHARGIVKEVSANRLVITDQSGKEVVFALTPSTTFFREKAVIPRETLKVGDRAVVHGDMTGAGLSAKTVKVGGASGASK